MSAKPTALFIVILLVSLLLFSATSHSAAGAGVIFAKTWGGPQEDEGFGVTTDANNSIYVAGYTDSFSGNICWPECVRALLLKYNSLGGLVWARTWGGHGDQTAHSVAVDRVGNVYLAGETGDVFLVKFTSQGNLTWARTIGGNQSDAALAITLDASGDVYVTGYTSSFGAGGEDVFFAKFDSNGTLLWEHTWGGRDTDRGLGIATDQFGGIYVTGGTVSFGSGEFCTYPNRCTDAFLLKLNATGGLLWQRMLGAPEGAGIGVATDSSGAAYVAGGVGSVVLLLKYDSLGNLLLQKTYTGKAVDFGRGIALDSSGNIFIVGDDTNSQGVLVGVLLMKLDSAGNILAQNTWSGGYEGYGITLDSSGNHIATGTVGGPGPYHLSPVNLRTGSPGYTSKSPGNNTLGTPNFPALNSSLSLASPVGNESYAGSRDLFLLKFGALQVPTISPWALVLTALLVSIVVPTMRRTRRII